MTIRAWILAALLALLPVAADAANCNSNPFTLTNGQTADATQVMANFNNLLNCSNNNLAHNVANSDITSLSGLTTPLSVPQGGTGAATFTANGALLGNGTSALQAVAPQTAGNLLRSNGTSWIAGNATGVIADATNGGLIIASSGIGATVGMSPGDLLVKSTLALSDGILLMDSAASNVPKTITFNAASASTPTILAGTDAVHWLTAAGFAGNKSFAANGYYKFPGGLVVQWGAVVLNAGLSTTVFTFPTPFTTGIFAAVATGLGGSADTSALTITATSTTALSVVNPSPNNTQTAYVIVLGQ